MVGGRPLLREILGQNSSDVTSSEKSSINANRKSTKRFPTSLRWSSYVAPKSSKRGLKNAKRPIPVKNALRLKNVCYKVSLCENCQRQSCKALISRTIRAKMIGGARPLLSKNLSHTDPPAFKTPIFVSIFARSASAVTPSEKVQLGSPLRAFQWAQDEHRTLSLENAKCLKFEQ